MLDFTNHERKANLTFIVRSVEAMWGVRITGTGRRCSLTFDARKACIRIAMREGFTRAEIARALGLDWTSVQNAALSASRQ